MSTTFHAPLGDRGRLVVRPTQNADFRLAQAHVDDVDGRPLVMLATAQ